MVEMIKESEMKGYIITVSVAAADGAMAEEIKKMGLVKQHAYGCTDIRDVISSEGK